MSNLLNAFGTYVKDQERAKQRVTTAFLNSFFHLHRQTKQMYIFTQENASLVPSQEQ